MGGGGEASGFMSGLSPLGLMAAGARAACASRPRDTPLERSRGVRLGPGAAQRSAVAAEQ